MRSDDLHQRFEALELEVLPLTGPPATEAIRRRGRRRQRAIRAAVLLSVVLVGAVAARGAARLGAQPDLQPVSPPPTTRPAVVTSTTTPPATSTSRPATTAGQSMTSVSPPPTSSVVLRADGLGVAAFGAAEQAAMRALQGRLGPPQERGSWNGMTPFGPCPGPVRAVRWGRLYVLFTSGPTPYGPDGRWHLFAWQVNQTQVTAIDPQRPDPSPPLRGYSPTTATGIGYGSTVAKLRAVYRNRLRITFGEPGMIHYFTVRRGATIGLSGALTGDTPQSTVTWLAAGAVCGE